MSDFAVAAVDVLRVGLLESLHKFGHVIDRPETHYRRRYPNVPDFRHDGSTSELVGIDEMVCTSVSACRSQRCLNLETTDTSFSYAARRCLNEPIQERGLPSGSEAVAEQVIAVPW